MTVAGATLGILFGIVHSLPAVTGRLDATVPAFARVLWLVTALVTVGGGVALIVAGRRWIPVLGIGLLGLVVLAVLNGYWVHGSPNPSHHVVRVLIAGTILALAVAG